MNYECDIGECAVSSTKPRHCIRCGKPCPSMREIVERLSALENAKQVPAWRPPDDVYTAGYKDIADRRDRLQASLGAALKERDEWKTRAEKAQEEMATVVNGRRESREEYERQYCRLRGERDEFQCMFGERERECAKWKARTEKLERDGGVFLSCSRCGYERTEWEAKLAAAEKRADAMAKVVEAAQRVVDAARRVDHGLARDRAGSRVSIAANGVDVLDGFDLLDLLRTSLAALDAMDAMAVKP